MDLRGKTAIVTGAGRGIGRKTATMIADEGCNVVLVSRTEKELREMLRDINLPVDPSCWMLPEDIAGCVLFLLKQSDRIVIKELITWASRHDQI